MKAFPRRALRAWLVGLALALPAPAAVLLNGLDEAAKPAVPGLDLPDLKDWGDPGQATADLREALALLGAHEFAKARPVLQRARVQTPLQPRAWTASIWLALREKNPGEAARLCDEAAGHFPNHAEVRVYHGIHLWGSGRLREAHGEFEKAARLDPRAPLPRAYLGNAAAALGRPLEAVQHYEAVLAALPDHVSTWRALSLAYAQAGNLKSALASARDGARHRPAEPMLAATLGQMLVRAGRAEEAVQVLGRIPDDPRISLEVFTWTAEAHLQLQQTEAACTALQRAVDAFPSEVMPRYRLASLRLAMGELNAAEAGLRRCLDLQPGFIPAANDLAALLADREPPDLEEAQTRIAPALAAATTDAAVLDTAGWIAHRRGDAASARRHLEAALLVLPGHPSIQLHLGLVLCASAGEEDRERGRRLLRSALTAQPSWAKRADVSAQLSPARPDLLPNQIPPGPTLESSAP